MMLTLVGLSRGVTDDMAVRNRGTGADIVVRPPSSNLFSLGGVGMSEKIVALVREQPHVALATGTLVQPVGGVFSSISGIHLNEFNALSGGFRYLSRAAHSVGLTRLIGRSSASSRRPSACLDRS